jgi:hypothetical protein
VRIDWIHPSWRDLVIVHLANDPGARARFLSRCSVHGVLLALSAAGGRDGQRQLPLLITDADWDALDDRVYALAPSLEVADLCALLTSIRQAIKACEPDRARIEASALARAVLERLARMWDHSPDPVPLQALDAWFALAADFARDPPPPAAPNLDHTWADLFPAASPDLSDRVDVERYADWLSLAELIREHQPGDLERLRFDDAFETSNEFLTKIDHAPDTIHPAAYEHVQTALMRIQTLSPERGARCMYLAGWLPDVTTEHEALTYLPAAPPGPERPGWRRFDVARVLRDL